LDVPPILEDVDAAGAGRRPDGGHGSRVDLTLGTFLAEEAMDP
jgi:hypothetical protein